MIHKNSYRLVILTLIGILIYSCQNDDPHYKNQNGQNDFSLFNDIVLGKKLENPYSVANMKKAMNNLKDSSKKLATLNAGAVKSTMTNNLEIDVKPTHLYVKFIPKNEEELAILERDSTLVLYSYPLDYEIIDGIGDYRDPDVPEGQPTYQYCAVKLDKQLPNEVEHEILEELFIPDEDKVEESTGTVKQFSTHNYNSNLIEELIDEALRITNNFEEIDEVKSDKEEEPNIQASGLFKRRKKWRPAGTIKVWDDNVSGYVAMEGVRVRARRWFTTHTGVTNVQGKYSCDGRFRRKARYLIKWKRQDFTIRWSWLSAAKYRGPRKKGNWNLNIRGGTQEFYATIFRAAHHYYYKNIKGLKRPPQNYSWKTKMKINAKYETNKDLNGQHCKDCRWFGIFSRIKIYNPHNSSSEIYATTIHELAHASHWELRRGKWNDNNLPKKVKESWATAVQWELTRMVYPDYKGRRWSTRLKDYTLVVTDMIDEYFKSGQEATNFGYIDTRDQVSGYTIKQIEDVLRDTSSWKEWKDNIKNRYDNDTEDNLEQIFRAYE